MSARLALIGVSGYTGLETLRLLAQHGKVTVSGLFGKSSAGTSLGEQYPHLRGRNFPDQIQDFDPKTFDASEFDICIFATPHQNTALYMDQIALQGVKVIDLSADFRFSDIKTYEAVYGQHLSPNIAKKAVYGLPELFLDEIKAADYCANPGCYVLTSLLGLLPLNQQGITGSVIIDAKSGVSGAGRQASIGKLFCEVNEGFSAYKTGVHRHQFEIGHILKQDKILFSPHLLPQNRGILASIYLKNEWGFTENELVSLYEKTYERHPFTKVYPGLDPSTKYVVGSNDCVIIPKVIGDQIVVFSAIDNLIRGSSGQAIENMNLMMGWDRQTGLQALPTYL